MKYINIIITNVKSNIMNENNYFEKSKTIVTKVSKNLYNLTVGKVFVGQFERSDLRYIIEQIDNNILIGTKS